MTFVKSDGMKRKDALQVGALQVGVFRILVKNATKRVCCAYWILGTDSVQAKNSNNSSR